jgi:hypothetical protein
MGVERKTRTPRIVDSKGGGARWFMVFFLGALLGGVGWFAFDYGREWAGLSLSDTGRSVKRLRESVAALTRERDELRQKLPALERSSQIDREASRLAQMELKKLQEERQELEKDLEFLRNLVGDEAAGALRITEFKLAATDKEREYSYRFTVSQLKEDFGMSKGRIDISIEGTFEGAAKTLKLAELTADKKKLHKMRFRHFQNIQGQILLPEGFTPDSLMVEVSPEIKNLPALRESFDWVVGG